MVDPETVRYYRARAAEYEQIYYRKDQARRREIDDEIERLVWLSRGKVVLDSACGSGFWTEHMSQNAALIVAIDISREMIGEARRKKYSCDVRFLQADLYRLPVRAAVFDLITLGFWFSHEPKQHYHAFFERITQPLRPGGRIWLIDNNTTTEISDRHHVRADRFGNNYRQRFLNDGTEFVILKNYFTEPSLREILGQRFRVDRLQYGHYYWSAVLSLR